MIRSIYRFLTVVVVAFLVMGRLSIATTQGAQQFTSDQSAVAVAEITKAANAICPEIPIKGMQRETKAAGDIDASLKGLIKKLVDLKIALSAQVRSNNFQGLIQEQLGPALKGAGDCKVAVTKILADRILPATANTKAEPPSHPTVSADHGGIAVGGNVSGSTLTTH